MKTETDFTASGNTFPIIELSDSNNSELPTQLCRSCGSAGSYKFCEHCGSDLSPRRISLKGIIHEVFHFFTHLDKGFLYTLKLLLRKPGIMQRDFVEGNRSRHQKPFSMFFICLTIAAISRYFIFKNLHDGTLRDDEAEIVFFDKYMVIFHIILLPLNALITYLFFSRSKYNYAETAVLTLYTVSFFLLVSAFIALFKLYWVDLDTAYIELPVILIYTSITNIHFFNSDKPLIVVLKSLGITVSLFILIQLSEDFVVRNIS